MIRSILATVVLAGALGTTVPASAGADTPPFTQCPAIGAATSCNVLVTIAGDGTAAIAIDTTLPPYDGSDDMVVGVQNNSPRPLAALTLTSTDTDIFGFDGDGLCTYITCTWPDPTTYEGPISVLPQDAAGADTGTVDFTGGLAAGSSTFFSLEGAPSSASATSATSQTSVDPATTNDPGFQYTAGGQGYGLTVTVASPPNLVAPNGSVVAPGAGTAGGQSPVVTSKPACNPGTNTGFFPTLAVTFTCLGSLQAFSDPDLAPKEWCVVNVGADVLELLPGPDIAKTTKVAKAAKNYETAAKALSPALKSTRAADETEAVLSSGSLLLKVAGNLAHADVPAAAEELVDALAGSDTLMTTVGKKLGNTKQTATAYKRFVEARNALKIVDDLTGISDVQACARAF
jgi:hypothetical protein